MWLRRRRRGRWGLAARGPCRAPPIARGTRDHHACSCSRSRRAGGLQTNREQPRRRRRGDAATTGVHALPTDPPLPRALTSPLQLLRYRSGPDVFPPLLTSLPTPPNPVLLPHPQSPDPESCAPICTRTRPAHLDPDQALDDEKRLQCTVPHPSGEPAAEGCAASPHEHPVGEPRPAPQRPALPRPTRPQSPLPGRLHGLLGGAEHRQPLVARAEP